VRVSLSITNVSWPDGAAVVTDNLERIARRCDGTGIDTIWVPDHLLQLVPGTDPEQGMLEAYTTLGYLAGVTDSVRLGTMVTGATFRAPTLLVKAVTTVDVLSRGRAWLGVGAGYHEAEAAMMGLFLPPPGERFERLTDLLRLALQMWAGDTSPFVGRYFRAEEPINSPAAHTQPHPPILIAGVGERRTLRLVAEYAQACNLYDIPDNGATLTRKLGVLADHCADVGREFHEIDKTVNTWLVDGESPRRFVERAKALASWGVDHVVAMAPVWTDAALDTVTAAVPALEHVGPGA